MVFNYGQSILHTHACFVYNGSILDCLCHFQVANCIFVLPPPSCIYFPLLHSNCQIFLRKCYFNSKNLSNKLTLNSTFKLFENFLIKMRLSKEEKKYYGVVIYLFQIFFGLEWSKNIFFGSTHIDSQILFSKCILSSSLIYSWVAGGINSRL